MATLIEIDATAAEAIAGFRVDRRRKYATHEDHSPCDISGAVIFALCKFTASCSGCYDGAGCEECGYTGKRQQAHWVPYLQTDAPGSSP